MKSVTAVIYTSKDDPNINDCVKSVQLLTGNYILVYPDSAFVETVRESGINQAKTDWVLILDADERMTKELAGEIISAIRNPQFSNYQVPRKNIFGKTKWLKHGGWWPDYQTRLINRKYFIDWPKRIHSAPEVKGESANLENPIIHYFHGDIGNMVRKTVVFEEIESELLFKAGKDSGTAIFFRKFFAELWRRLAKELGFLDGPVGIIESVYQAFSKTITYLFLYEKKRNKKT